MAAAASEEDIDFETLQAQLDKTWAYAHSVVDSWTKPGNAPADAAPGVMSDKELNDLLRRPSRCAGLLDLYFSPSDYLQTGRWGTHARLFILFSCRGPRSIEIEI